MTYLFISIEGSQHWSHLVQTVLIIKIHKSHLVLLCIFRKGSLLFRLEHYHALFLLLAFLRRCSIFLCLHDSLVHIAEIGVVHEHWLLSTLLYLLDLRQGSVLNKVLIEPLHLCIALLVFFISLGLVMLDYCLCIFERGNYSLVIWLICLQLIRGVLRHVLFGVFLFRVKHYHVELLLGQQIGRSHPLFLS